VTLHLNCARSLALPVVAAAILGMSACSSNARTGSPITTSATSAATATAATAATATTPATVAPTTANTSPSTAGADPLDIVVNSAVVPPATSIDATLRTADGRERTYHVYVPAAVTTATTPVPLLVALHGGTGWGKQFELNSGFDGLAEANGFVVVYPDGIGVGTDGTQLRTWNGGACCGPAVKQQVDDVGFIRQLIAVLESQYNIDRSRVFAAGHSNGGILAYRLACELSDQIVAIGVQSSAMEVTGCAPDLPVSAIHIHGSADQNVPIGGGIGPNAISGVAFNPPIDGATTLAAVDGCPAAPTVSTSPANADLDITTWSPCTDGSDVEFVEVAGASHAWMGHTAGGSGKVGAPYADLDSSLVIWNFLSQHARG